jgi:hypothetical protein
MTGGIMLEGGGITSANPLPEIATVDVRGVGASLDPPQEVEATPHLIDLDHRTVTRLGVIVEAILEVSLARPPGTRAQKRQIKNANVVTLQEMKRRSTVGPILTHQNPKVMLKMPSRKINAPSLYPNLS